MHWTITRGMMCGTNTNWIKTTEKGHWKKESRMKKHTSIHATDGIHRNERQNCFCGKKGHMVPNCPEKDARSG